MNFKIISLSILVTMLMCGCGLSTEEKEGTNYYFDSIDGSDENNGLSEGKAWKSFGNIDNIQLKAGDSILLRRGSVFGDRLEITAQGRSDCGIVVDAYGSGNKPCISAPDSSLFAVQVKNSDYLTVQNLEIINTGTSRLPGRTGIKVLSENHGISRSITLNALDIHDVNGSLVKNEGGGSGILIVSGGEEKASLYDSLLIENCVIRRCERNAIIWSAPSDRDYGRYSTNTIVRKNMIEEVPGDGIVPIACDGAVIEYNVMRNCPDVLSPDEAAAGIWPWSCDNTLIQFNEVSGHNAKWDGQGFDADYNCRNTIIQYNYSHDNAGGFLLVCNDGNSLGKPWNIGTLNTTVRYNISVNDGIRNYPTKQAGWFTPVFHITGPVENTMIYNNLIVQHPKESDSIDNRILKMGDWGNKWPEKTQLQNNVFCTVGGSSGSLDFGSDRNTSEVNNVFVVDKKFSRNNKRFDFSFQKISEIIEAKTLKDKIDLLKNFFGCEEFKYQAFHPGELWLDNNGEHINAHGGGIMFYDGIYYWFGEHKSANTSAALIGVRCYSSEDLYNWKDEGVALPVVKNNPSSPITKGCTIERPKVIYNKETKQFVMFFHLELKGQVYDAAKVGIATSKSPAGPYSFIKALRPNAGKWPVNMTEEQQTMDVTIADFKEWWTPEWRKAVEDGLFVRRDFSGGQMSRDMTLFVDDDGKAYHIYSSEENLTIHIAELTKDYLGYTGKYTRLFPGGHNEAPAIFKHNNKYYLITSGCTGWDPNPARSAVASTIWGPWEMIGNPCVGKGGELTFNSQSTFVLPVQGQNDKYIFMGDRWNPGYHIDGRYIWLPITFSGEKPVVKWQDYWKLQ
ncbi:family 43 glycosylhydrolase [Plebeiibacterium marinum]|uniref:Family 43 glycosylhydrolase n=1 Tax=Plebeiibacterium marinum TaxID=2992111 RepID=A0AAE3SJI1_9BACT|nr:family 43 glycosylhydrolase [Plebeiobacterium marinum]MCW3805494.1 family 43 glycosylhydrolase [Plebeiobacterium marinum]